MTTLMGVYSERRTRGPKVGEKQNVAGVSYRFYTAEHITTIASLKATQGFEGPVAGPEAGLL